MVHVAALIRELMRQSQDAQENAHQIYCWAEKKRENWDFVVAYCDKKLTLARNYIDKITKQNVLLLRRVWLQWKKV